MALSISQIVNVQLNTVPKSAARKSFGIVVLFTPEAGQALLMRVRVMFMSKINVM